MKDPVVSIIIPCYNAAHTLDRAVRSAVQQQSIQPDIILINNNSSDNTADKIKAWQQQHPSLIKTSFARRRNANYARNEGIKMAASEYLQFLDADDAILPNKIADQLKLLLSTDADYVAGSTIFINENTGKTSEIHPFQDPYKGWMIGLFNGNTVANLWRRSVLNDIGNWNENIPDTQDDDLMLRLLCNNTYVVQSQAPTTLVHIRDSGHLHQVDKSGHVERHVKLRLEMLQYLYNNKPTYFHQNQTFFHQAFYIWLRKLAVYDPGRAAMLLRQHLPSDFRPRTGVPHAEVPLWNRLLMPFLGFERTERFKNYSKRGPWRSAHRWARRRFLEN